MKLQKNLFDGTFPLTQKFGENPQNYAKFGLKGHNGIDYGVPTGTKLYSCINGKVIEAQLDATGYGNYVKIENDECGVLYGHLKSFNVKVGDTVTTGQVLGLSNNTGNSTGPHLHFGVFPKPRDRNNGYNGYINPLDKSLVEWVDSSTQIVCENEDINTEVENKYKLKDFPRYDNHWTYGNLVKDWTILCKNIDVLNSTLLQSQDKYDNVVSNYTSLLDNYNGLSVNLEKVITLSNSKDLEIERLKDSLSKSITMDKHNTEINTLKQGYEKKITEAKNQKREEVINNLTKTEILKKLFNIK